MRTSQTPAAVTFTDVQQLPLVLTADLVMALYHIKTYEALRWAIRSKRVPPPNAVKPFRWHKADLVRHLTQPRAAARESRRKRVMNRVTEVTNA